MDCVFTDEIMFQAILCVCWFIDAHSVPSDEVYEKAVTTATKVYSYQGEDDNGQFVIVHEDKAQVLKIALLDTKKVKCTGE